MDYIVVGLGNPGKRYAYTRHNVGWIALDYITDKLGVKTNKLKFKSLCGEATVNEKKVLFLKPQTFMNLSGEAVFAASSFYNIPPERILVICDDIALPSNKIRIRRHGSDGGHRGLRSIIMLLGSDSFPRIKIGVSDRSNPDMDLKDWVTGEMTDDELNCLDKKLPDMLKATEAFISDNLEKAMAEFN